MKKRTKVLFVIIALIIAASLLGAAIAVVFIKKGNAGDGQENRQLVTFSNTFSGKVGQSFEFLGKVKRNIPQIQNEGKNERYPTYGTSLANITDEEKDNILSEDAMLRASETTYDSMDSDGNLYLGGVATGKKLYKHTSSVGMYYGDVSDTEEAVVEKITIESNEMRNFITGLYAPAGEVIKIEISSEDLSSIGGELLVSVGQVSHRNVLNNIWKARNDFSRMPNIGNKMAIKTTTAYVGNYLGGPIYVYPKTFGKKFSVTISGAVRYPYYIHGLTTREEVEEMKNFSAPYFDFEVWDLGVRHSGPKKYANFDYDNLFKVGNLWEKICRTSRLVPCSANAAIGVGFVYDCFVAAGSACAFQGGHSWVNAPCSWLEAALNYESMTKDGFWGVIHEFNHLYQSYGMYETKTNEVTNNATNLLSYILYTNISAARSENDSTLSGWNRFTDPSRSLRETISLAESGSAQLSLNAYSDLIHAFGVDVFTKAAREQTKLGVDGWYEAISKATGYNMTFYFEEMLHQTISDEMKAIYDDSSKITFVPVASLFQTGRNYFSQGKVVLVETVRPYEIEKGEPYVLNFNERLVVPSGFGFKIKSISDPKHGKLEKQDENIYKFIPDENEYSGTIKVVIELEHPQIKTKDVTLTLNFRQRITNLLSVTRYAYSSRIYNSVDDALGSDFSGYESMTQSKSSSTFLNKIANNHIGIVEGKIYIPEDGEYAFCLRSGRGNNTLWLSVNQKDNLQQVLSLNSDHGGFSTSGEHVVKYNLKAGDFVYFKEITLSRHAYNDAFTELGWANLTKNENMVTIPSKYLYNKDVEKTEYSFETPEVYKRNYQESISLSKADLSKQSIVSVNHSSWSNDQSIQNILDGNLDTFYHNNRNNFVSEDNPFELEVDLGEIVRCNKITITSRKTGQLNLPSTFKLYGGKTQDEMSLLGNYVDLPLKSNTVEATFDDAEIKYYKIVVTDTKSASAGNKYVTIAQIDLEYIFAGVEKTPFDLKYYKTDLTNFSKVKIQSTYGWVTSGNGEIEYEFEGTGIALFARQTDSCKIKVEIDGEVREQELFANGEKQMFFIATNLQNKNHKLKIIVLKGNLNIDSFITK